MSDEDGGRLVERVEEPDKVPGELKDVVSLHGPRAGALPVPPEVRRHGVVTSRRQWRELMPPGVAQLGEPVTEDHWRSLAELADVQLNTGANREHPLLDFQDSPDLLRFVPSVCIIPSMSPQEMRSSLEAYVEAVNRHDVDAMLELRHPDSYLEVMGVAPPIQGKAALKEFYDAFYGSVMPDYRLDITGSAFAADTCVVWGHYSGTVPEGHLGTDARGGSTKVPVCFVCVFENGLFCGDHMYTDPLAGARQTGSTVPPQRKKVAP
jgi:hypothetical protein